MNKRNETDAGWAEPVLPQLGNDVSSASLLQAGPPISPITRLLTYDSSEWEAFVNEWVTFLPAQYRGVERYTGSGDKGVDVAGFHDTERLLGQWANYQCKHYGKPLGPADAFVEIGKCLWHAYEGHFNLPSRYVFVAPRGVSTKLGLLLANATRLREELYLRWDGTVATKIVTGRTISLNGDFETFVDAVDFSLFEAAAPLQIIEEHRTTPYFIQRFGGALPPRPKMQTLPEIIDPHETVYTAKLFRAYADHVAMTIAGPDDLNGHTKLRKHFHRSREAFYHSESLRVFVRDKTVPGTYESLQNEVLDAVADTCDAEHDDGYARVIAVTDLAQSLNLEAHPLSPSTLPRDLKGICHQLANDDRLDWVERA